MKYDKNKCVLRPDLNDSKDLALCTLEGRAFQRTGAHVANAFSPNEHLTLRGVNIPVPEDLRLLLGTNAKCNILGLILKCVFLVKRRLWLGKYG